MVASGRSGPVHIRAEVTTASKDASFCTQIRAAFDPPLGVDLSLTAQGVMAGVGKLFGAQDIELGDSVFDKKFVVKGKDPRRVSNILSSEARSALIALQATGHELEVNDQWVELMVPGIVDNEDILWSQLSLVIEAGAAMVRYRRPEAMSPYR